MIQLVFNWILKTRTNFYNVQHDQFEPLTFIWFGLCCWNYIIAGVTMIYTKPSYIPIWFPYDTFALFLIYIQSPISYMADYVCITKDSYWHAIDRCIAIPGMILEMIKYIIMIRTSIQFPHLQHYVTCILYGLSLLFALYCFLQSQRAQERIDRNGFSFWHTMWHLYPCIASTIIWVDHWYQKEYPNRKLHSVDVQKISIQQQTIYGTTQNTNKLLEIKKTSSVIVTCLSLLDVVLEIVTTIGSNCFLYTMIHHLFRNG